MFESQLLPDKLILLVGKLFKLSFYKILSAWRIVSVQ